MISVIIPIFNYNDNLLIWTDDCLKSLKETSKDHELILIDNGSPSQVMYDADVYVRNEINQGVAKAWNQGLKLATGDQLLIANSDVLFSDGWQDILSDKYEIVFPLTRCKEDDDYKRRLAGFFWGMNRKTYNLIGNISEEYGTAYYEDTDYFMRAMEAGVKLRCDESVKIYHYGQATAEGMDSIDQEYCEKNKFIYDNKFDNKYPYLT